MVVPDFLARDDNGWVHFVGHRIGLENLVFLYNQGYSPEMLSSEYPTLSLAEIHKAIAFYLENHLDVDQYVASCDCEVDQHRAAAQPTPSLEALRQRAEAARGIESA